MKTLSGYDRTSGKKGPRAKSRLESSQRPEVLDALKALQARGETEISAREAAEILGGKRQRFANMVVQGKLQRGHKKLMTISSLITWVAKGVAQRASRERYGIMSELEWLRDG